MLLLATQEGLFLTELDINNFNINYSEHEMFLFRVAVEPNLRHLFARGELRVNTTKL
jgi:hypothetical protein